MRTHVLRTSWENTIDDESMDIDLEVEFHFEPATRGRAPDMHAQGRPGEGPHVDAFAAYRLFNGQRVRLPKPLEDKVLDSQHIIDLCVEQAENE